MSKPQIFPSDIFAAIDAHKQRVAAEKKQDAKDVPPYGAFRINFGRPQTTAYTTYFPFEVNLVKHGWTSVSLKFFNLKHVGKIGSLLTGEKPRKDEPVKAVSVLFKEDYVFERQTQVNGRTEKIKEPYGKAKDMIDRAYRAHVKKYQKAGKLPTEASVTAIVKRFRNAVGNNGIKKKVPIEGPGNINVAVKFSSEKGQQPDQTNPNTTFRCPILDARYERPNRQIGEWVKDDAKLPDADGNRTITLNNGNIHEFIRGGSLISGVDNMGSVCLSQGQSKISLPCKLDICIVRPAKPQRVSQSDFDDDDMATIDGVVDPEPEPVQDSFETNTSAQSGEFSELGNLDGPPDDETDDFGDDTNVDADDFGDPAPDADDDLFDDL